MKPNISKFERTPASTKHGLKISGSFFIFYSSLLFSISSLANANLCHFFYIKGSLTPNLKESLWPKYREQLAANELILETMSKEERMITSDALRVDILNRLISKLPSDFSGITQNEVFELHSQYMTAKTNLDGYLANPNRFSQNRVNALMQRLSSLETLLAQTHFFEKLKGKGFKLVPGSHETIKQHILIDDLRTIKVLELSWTSVRLIIQEARLANADPGYGKLRRLVLNAKGRHQVATHTNIFLKDLNEFIRLAILPKYNIKEHDLETFNQLVEQVLFVLDADYFKSIHNSNLSSIRPSVRLQAQELERGIAEFRNYADRITRESQQPQLVLVKDGYQHHEVSKKISTATVRRWTQPEFIKKMSDISFVTSLRDNLFEIHQGLLTGATLENPEHSIPLLKSHVKAALNFLEPSDKSKNLWWDKMDEAFAKEAAQIAKDLLKYIEDL